MTPLVPEIFSKPFLDSSIGEVFVSSIYNVPCMYVRMFVIRDGI